jgi:DNA-directed RNA polymerase subunit omega
MARVTVEDCTNLIPNQFELVALAAERAKMISTGSPILVERDNDKDSVVSLREIAEEKIDIEALRKSLIQSHQKLYRGKAVLDEDDSITMEAHEEMISMLGDADESIADEDGFSFADENIDIDD